MSEESLIEEAFRPRCGARDKAESVRHSCPPIWIKRLSSKGAGEAKTETFENFLSFYVEPFCERNSNINILESKRELKHVHI